MRSIHPIAACLLTFCLVSPALPSITNFGANFTQNAEWANVSVTGRIKTPEGRPIKGAYIAIKDANTNEVVRTTYSSAFGYYRLDQIETGRTYVLSVSHRRYLFAFPAQLLEINEERTGMDFTGEPTED